MTLTGLATFFEIVVSPFCFFSTSILFLLKYSVDNSYEKY